MHTQRSPGAVRPAATSQPCLGAKSNLVLAANGKRTKGEDRRMSEIPFKPQKARFQQSGRYVLQQDANVDLQHRSKGGRSRAS